ncbi:MAG: hypothetical protein JXA44_10795 [Methanospirillaceae archaeon]|nr:hypothetical protein [Methanospirillaceae archaeon]
MFDIFGYWLHQAMGLTLEDGRRRKRRGRRRRGRGGDEHTSRLSVLTGTCPIRFL